MSLNNLELSFNHQEDTKCIFKDSKGAEVSIDISLLADFEYQQGKVFLAMDKLPLIFSEEDRKGLLNSILNE